MTTRTFNTNPVHMAATLAHQPSPWVDTGNDAATVRDFFVHVVKNRPGCRFDIHGEQGVGWSKGDSISFVHYKTGVSYGSATLERYVSGAHPNADPKTNGHFFLEDIGSFALVKPASLRTRPISGSNEQAEPPAALSLLPNPIR